MVRPDALLRQMRENPAGNWTIKDIEKVCRANGLSCEPPRGGGSHYKVFSPHQSEILTVPFRRPIKAVYIRKLVGMIEAEAGR